MANTVKIRKGTGVPSAESFAEAEPAWDKTNKKLYIKAEDGTMAEVGGGSGVDPVMAGMIF